jgi:plastocyanin
MMGIALLIFLTALPAVRAAAGSISGTVTVNGLPSAANILVYLNKAPQQGVDLSGAKFVMDQQNLTFIPHVLPVPVGASVLFPNNDKVDHNIFSLSQTKKFNLGKYKPGESRTEVFDKPGIVELRCDVHAEMLAYIYVMANPYFGVTDAKGHFRIPDLDYLKAHGISRVAELPAGSYAVKTRHEKLKTESQEVQVPAQGEVQVELKLKRGPAGVLYK